MPEHESIRIKRAKLTIEGLSLGDSFGQQFFYRESWADSPAFRRLPPPIWCYTDDTEMALAVYEALSQAGKIDQDMLAALFLRRFELDPHRGYGSSVQDIFRAVAHGTSWREAASSAFNGQGSFGNGAAMRVAPIGAYFADDLDALTLNAELSSGVTHTHPEAIAGAVAVALAAAWACNKESDSKDDAGNLFEFVLAHTPESETSRGIETAMQIPPATWEFHAAERLGNGSRLTAMDTVPLCIWLAARHRSDYCEALWTTAALGGDIDTNCAIVGSIVALAVGSDELPASWLERRETLHWKV